MNTGARAPVRRKLSGSISMMAVASMKPEPSAIKYRRYLRCQCFWTMIAPPKPFAAAAVSPSRIESAKGDIKFSISVALVMSMDVPAKAKMQLLPEQSVSCAVADVHYITILHDVVFAFQF